MIDGWRMAHWVEVDGRDLAAAILDTTGVTVAASWPLHGHGPGRIVVELPVEPSAERSAEGAPKGADRG